jgi:amino acid transporter
MAESLAQPVIAEAVLQERDLLKTLRWWDGLAIGFTVPASAFGVLGASIGVLGAWGAVFLWAISSIIGGFQSWIYAETAAMFPEKPGGIALYAHEGWRRYFTPVGPVATFGYWFAWSSVLAIYGLVIGTLAQAQWFSSSTWSVWDGAVHVGLAQVIAIGAIFVCWIVNTLGIRPTVLVQYVIGIALLVPMFCLMVLPFILGDVHSSNLTWGLNAKGLPWGGWKIAFVWLYLMGWTVYSSEICASFAPEYRDTARDTQRALMSTALFIVVVFALMPLGTTGVIGAKAIAANPVGFFVPAFNKVVGQASGLMTALLILGFLLVMNGSSADGSRALYGISRDGMTIKQLFHLNRFHVPARAMTVDLVVNIGLVLFVSTPLAILVAGNLGYFLAHIFALSGFLLLRKDRPNWPRPIRRARPFVLVAAFLILLNTFLVYVGVTSSSLTGYGGTKETLIGVGVLLFSLVLFAYRRKVQDRAPLGLREPTPSVPEEAAGFVSAEAPATVVR